MPCSQAGPFLWLFQRGQGQEKDEAHEWDLEGSRRGDWEQGQEKKQAHERILKDDDKKGVVASVHLLSPFQGLLSSLTPICLGPR